MIQTQDSTFAYLMQDVTRQMRTVFDRRATRFALTRAQWRALKVIRRHEGLSQTELASKLGVTQGTISRFETGDLPVDERTQLAVDALLMRHRSTPPEWRGAA